MEATPGRAVLAPAAMSARTFTTIRKRDGRLVPFSAEAITRALAKAGAATGEYGPDMARALTLRALAALVHVCPESDPDVETVQDVVEQVLLGSPFMATAKAYILYRDQHARVREIVSASRVEMVDQYLERLDWQVNENSNMAYSLQGLNNYISGEVSKAYWLNKLYPTAIREAHSGGDLHLHDLGLLSVYCVGWDLQALLWHGFKGVPGKAESAPARHFRSALGQVVNFFYTLQGEAAGAQAFSSFDTLLAPFIRADGLTEREVKQALQEFVFNLNVPTRVGFQTPFTNVTLDLVPPETLRRQPVIVGGQPGATTYGDYQAEMDMFNRAFLDVLAEGDAKGRVFTFPIPTYNITRDFDWEAPGIGRLWEVTARYGIPYFANFVNADLSPEDARSMCCRLRLDVTELRKRGGGLFGANPLTGSIGVATLNMPRLGHVASGRDDFFARLDRLMDLAKDSLEIKRRVLEGYTDKGLFPYTRFYLNDVHQRLGRWWANHFSTIGLVGMNECCLGLLGAGIDTPQGAAFAEDTLRHMRARLARYQQETGNYYNLEATPAEGTSYRLARLDRERHPGIHFANAAAVEGGAEPYYTNSTQLPVDRSSDPFEILAMQDGLQALYTGGTVQHVHLGEAVPDPASVKAFVRAVCANHRLPYFTLSPVFSICPGHGYLSGRHDACPRCGAKAEVYARVVGYLRPVDQWNAGKRAEFEQRAYADLGGIR